MLHLYERLGNVCFLSENEGKRSVLISCKVSNSVITFLERQGRDLSPFFQNLDVPEDFLRDTSCWLEAEKMEALLKDIDTLFTDIPDNYLREIGRQNEQLRTWGVLDSVLKMVESPQDIYCQPSRFISYFISPEPPIASWRQDGEVIRFQLPVLASQYPYITSYLTGALEGLPLYMRQPLASVKWQDSQIDILWKQTQESLLPDDEMHLRQFNPQWVRSMMESLEKHQKNLENRSSSPEAMGMNSEELRELQNFLRDSSEKFEFFLQESLAVKNDFLKLHDYFVRSQQLVTFLVHSGRKTKQVDEAMRRMDWTHVQSSYNQMVEEACDRLLKNKATMQELSLSFEKFKKSTESKNASDENLPLPM